MKAVPNRLKKKKKNAHKQAENKRENSTLPETKFFKSILILQWDIMIMKLAEVFKDHII